MDLYAGTTTDYAASSRFPTVDSGNFMGIIDGAVEIAAQRASTVTPSTPRRIGMPKGQQKSNREAKKPKKEKIMAIAATPSRKTTEWQPAIGTGKQK
jgi:hypothetical protein